ncbi:MAG: phosphoenolpyruvate carboxylase, partial [Gemmatimonadetes bacterium]|nr:phosphoenolpyruvate carboxylase [Gemmatimonadota bacterium]
MADADPLWTAGSQAERLAELTADDAALKEAPLRRDVRSLGKLLGQVMREQEGEEFFKAVERLRHLAMGHRDLEEGVAGVADDERMRDAEEIVGGLGLREAYRLTKAFSTYFELTNLAETQHRKRRRRGAQLRPGDPAQAGTIRGTLERLRDAGVGREAALEQLARVLVVPVFTAHP